MSINNKTNAVKICNPLITYLEISKNIHNEKTRFVCVMFSSCICRFTSSHCT